MWGVNEEGGGGGGGRSARYDQRGQRLSRECEEWSVQDVHGGRKQNKE